MRDFLSAVLGDLGEARLGELRSIKDGVVRQSYHASVGAIEAEALVLDTTGHDVYYGVLPRRYQSGKGEAIDDTADVMWADFDAKAFMFHNAKELAFRSMASIAPEAQIVVDSGNGYHAYWLLDRQYPFAEVREVMKGIALLKNADKTYDKARILRIPGTDNHKTDPPNPVRLLRFNLLARRHRLSDFVQYAEAGMPPAPAPRVEHTGPAPEFDSLPGWLANLIVNGAENADRSADCFKVVCQLIERGYRDEEIEDIFADNPRGIGEKYDEKGSRGPEWMGYTLKAAHASVERGR